MVVGPTRITWKVDLEAEEDQTVLVEGVGVVADTQAGPVVVAPTPVGVGVDRSMQAKSSLTRVELTLAMDISL